MIVFEEFPYRCMMYQMVSINCLDALWRTSGCLPTGSVAPRMNSADAQLRRVMNLRWVEFIEKLY